MVKSEKLVVLGVLLVVVLLFVWSLQSDGTGTRTDNGIQASERDSVTAPRNMNARQQRGDSAPSGTTPDDSLRGRKGTAPARGDGGAGRLERDVLQDGAKGNTVAGGSDIERVKARPNTNGMLLAETGGAASSGTRSNDTSLNRPGASSLADSAVTPAATSRTGGGRVRMQPGWDLVTTQGLSGTVDPAMFVYSIPEGAEALTWEALAKDLYGDESKGLLLRHNNEGLEIPEGEVFVPAKDELGQSAEIRTVEVLKGETLWEVARRSLGKGTEWRAVYEANRDVISDPNLVAPGTKLRIPIR